MPLNLFQLYIIFIISLTLLKPNSCTQFRTVLDVTATNTSSTCPMSFDVLNRYVKKRSDILECRYILQGLRLVQSHYFKSTGLFLPPLNSSEACWDSYQELLNGVSKEKVEVRSKCGFKTEWMSQGCMNISSREEFEGFVPESALVGVRKSCNRNQSLGNNAACSTCNTKLSGIQASYLNGEEVGNVTECSNYPFIYAAAFSSDDDEIDDGTVKCLFSLDVAVKGNGSSRKVISIAVGCFVTVIFIAFVGFLFFLRKRRKRRRGRKVGRNGNGSTVSVSGLDSMSVSTNLVRYTFDEIKQATRKFHRDNIIGKGGFGNVYRGLLYDGSEVALKRFKNCSAAGDASFAHEVEVIASVRHVNLVALRGYCTATTPYEGHQRIIVCDLMRNGSLHDHLFESDGPKLSWPVRQKIALGTAKGLAYLHYGAQPGIIHRDIKASNILLDENFEAKVGDFGLAKFTPEGMTHLSTRVAGTMGYVAPEYALYGQLTERSDVYSFGVVLLELLSGQKALTSTVETPTNLVTDWAWSLVKRGRPLDVVEEDMPELGPPEIMEKYVMIAVLSSHPQLYARPTMDQIVKILETDLPVPTIPERPISIVTVRDDIERSISGLSNSNSNLSSPAGYRTYNAFESEVSSLERGKSNLNCEEDDKQS